MSDKKESALGNFLLATCFYVLHIYLKTLIISDLLRWFQIPIELSRQNIFGLLFIYGIVIASIKHVKAADDKPSETTADIIKHNVLFDIVMLVLWLIFYIIYSLLFK
jgi:hypothetical protein